MSNIYEEIAKQKIPNNFVALGKIAENSLGLKITEVSRY